MLFFCIWYVLMPINALSPFPFRMSESFIKLIIALLSLVPSSAYLQKNTQWSNIINDINIVEGFGTGNEYIWILTFYLSPLTYQLIKYTKVEKKIHQGCFSLCFPLEWREQSTRKHEVLLQLTVALACALLYMWESILSHFSEEGRTESIFPFPTPK